MVEKQHVYIIGSKGIPAKYGGFETFVDKLTKNQQDESIQYHVACMTENSAKSRITDKEFVYNGAMCFNIDVPSIGPAKAIYYDIKALEFSIELAKKNGDKQPIFYVLACRIGPFIGSLKKEIKKLNGKLYVNPDGHEWLRAKWSYPVRRYWKYSEKLMVKHADLLICDSKNIEKYIQNDYAKYNPSTTYIAYGTDTKRSELSSESQEVRNWFDSKKITEDNYYLVVGRFVPENNYESMIKEFMKSDSKKDFVLITNVEKNKFYDKLLADTKFDQDKRIKFVGTVYNQELLKYIRENAFGYIHGHEVGGTNPSLLEALSSTKLNLLLKVGFNEEVAGLTALYWKKDDLHVLLSDLESYSQQAILDFDSESSKRIRDCFTWPKIVKQYEITFNRE
ncbi:TPA: beta 1-4 rhamnosyltransferase Cps2T [Enterococcus faecium]